MGWLQTWKRKKLDRESYPKEWKQILEDQIVFHRQLTDDQKEQHRRLVRYFLSEKSFEACGGMVLGDLERVTIAGMACIPLIGGVSDLYPFLRAVLVYPDTYRAPYSESGMDGVVSEGVESRSGESWDQGVVVLAWKEIAFDVRHPFDGSNIVIHECAHQLDYEWGATMESFSWQPKRTRPGMAAILKTEYQRYLASLEKSRTSVIDDYAATNIHEFFAVLTEAWFERQEIVRKYFPEVHRVFSDFYNMNSGVEKF